VGCGGGGVWDCDAVLRLVLAALKPCCKATTAHGSLCGIMLLTRSLVGWETSARGVWFVVERGWSNANYPEFSIQKHSNRAPNSRITCIVNLARRNRTYSLSVASSHELCTWLTAVGKAPGKIRYLSASHFSVTSHSHVATMTSSYRRQSCGNWQSYPQFAARASGGSYVIKDASYE
jgi:hypothetical protein